MTECGVGLNKEEAEKLEDVGGKRWKGVRRSRNRGLSRLWCVCVCVRALKDETLFITSRSNTCRLLSVYKYCSLDTNIWVYGLMHTD